MLDNWYVLCVAILNKKPLSIEKAFEIYRTGKIDKRRKWKVKDLEDIYKLKRKGITYVELAEIYGSNDSSICYQLNKFIKK